MFLHWFRMVCNNLVTVPPSIEVLHRGAVEMSEKDLLIANKFYPQTIRQKLENTEREKR